MSLFSDIIKNNKDMVIDTIFDDEMQMKIVKALNENVDIPIISEKTEEKILNAIYDSVEEVIKSAMKEKL